MVSQENNNNLENDNNLEKLDLEENMGVQAAHGKGVELSAANLTVDQSMEKCASKDDPIEMEALPDQPGNNESMSKALTVEKSKSKRALQVNMDKAVNNTNTAKVQKKPSVLHSV